MPKNILARACASRPARAAMRVALNCYAHNRQRQAARVPAAETQHETLLRLVRHARHTRFGREHDFAGIRTVRDYQQRVPLRDYEAFWRDYWQRGFPLLDDVTWPSRYPYFALTSGTTSAATKYIPVSRQMLRSNRQAAITSLAWFAAAHPEVRLFDGKFFFLGGSTDLQPAHLPGEAKDGAGTSLPLMGDLSGIVTKEASSLLERYTFPPLRLALMSDWEQKLQLLAEESAQLPITGISGVPSWILTLFDRLRQVTGCEHVSDIWPSLRLVVHGGTRFDPYRSVFRDAIGSSDVHFLETYPASEGFIAAEDPAHGLLRLITDHGIFFEFVPTSELTATAPVRHSLAEIVPGIQYAVVLTTCAGLWSYLLGDTICFESRDPPLLRFTGRTRQFLSAFGEHLIGEEVERAVAVAATEANAAATDFHVGPVFPSSPAEPGRHRYFVEFASPPTSLPVFSRTLDATLGELNEDYRAHRQGDLTLGAPEVVPVPRGGFSAWMKSRGKLGGQNKVPRMDNSGELTRSLAAWLTEAGYELSGIR